MPAEAVRMGSRTRSRTIAALLALAAAGAGRTAQVREQAKAVLQSHRCDKCHDSTVSAENQKALAVYDLAQADWPARMSDARLPKLLNRLRSAPAADKALVRSFIAQELKDRGATGR
jgi:hypothetical protein